MSDLELNGADGVTRELDMAPGGAIELEAMTQAPLMKSDDVAEFHRAWSEGRKAELEGTMSGHEIVTAPELAAPSGYAHAVIAAPGRVVHLGGQTAMDASGKIVGRGIVEQFDVAAGNVAAALRAAGCEPDDLVSMQIFVTDLREYRFRVRELAPVWRKWFGRRYPAIGLFGVTELFDDDAQVELMAVAVRPDR